jgi:trigger factor
MKTELTHLSPVRKRLKIEVPASDVAVAFDRIVRSQREKARIPGFRPGKAPVEMIRRRLGPALGQEAAEAIVETFTEAAIRQEGLRPIRGGIALEVPHDHAHDHDHGHEHGHHHHMPPAEEGTDYTYTVSVEVMPEIEPQNYTEQTIARPRVELEPEEVQRELTALRQARAEPKPVEGRPSRTGDIVSVEIEGHDIGGEPLVPRDTRTVRLGADETLPEFERGLTGLYPGQSFSFEVDYPEDFSHEQLRGRRMRFSGETKELRELELPELTAEFAREVGGVDSVDALRERMEEFLRQRKEHEADTVVRRRLLDKLLDDNEFEVPPVLIENEVRGRLEDVGRQMSAQGIDPEKLDVDWNKIIADEKARAERLVRESLLLDAVASKESIEVEEAEIDEAVAEMATRSESEPRQLKQELRQRGGLQVLKIEILRRKTLDWLISRTHIR